MSKIKIYKKVNWKTDLTKTWQEVYYPSLVPNIIKSDSYFYQHFEIKIINVTEEVLHSLIFPVYTTEIVQRENYIFDGSEQKQKILYNLYSDIPYQLLAVFKRDDNEFVGGCLFSIREEFISVAIRAFKRDITKRYKSKTTLDYWVDTKLYDHCKNIRTVLSHGSDSYPIVQRLGLPLFKLKVGAKPAVSYNQEYQLFTPEELHSNLPLMYFSNPKKGIYQEANIICNDNNDSVINSLVPVLEWAKIKLVKIKDNDYSI
jgi:hypothetical protein